MCLGNVNVTQEECPETVYTVIVGSWWWWDMALTDESESGETVWMRTTVSRSRPRLQSKAQSS